MSSEAEGENLDKQAQKDESTLSLAAAFYRNVHCCMRFRCFLQHFVREWPEVLYKTPIIQQGEII